MEVRKYFLGLFFFYGFPRTWVVKRSRGSCSCFMSRDLKTLHSGECRGRICLKFMESQRRAEAECGTVVWQIPQNEEYQALVEVNQWLIQKREKSCFTGSLVGDLQELASSEGRWHQVVQKRLRQIHGQEVYFLLLFGYCSWTMFLIFIFSLKYKLFSCTLILYTVTQWPCMYA